MVDTMVRPAWANLLRNLMRLNAVVESKPVVG
jgi:hypothetical protein